MYCFILCCFVKYLSFADQTDLKDMELFPVANSVMPLRNFRYDKINHDFVSQLLSEMDQQRFLSCDSWLLESEFIIAHISKVIAKVNNWFWISMA
jgi:hypothetical protein